MIIDMHTHIFPDKIAEKTIKTLENNILEREGEARYACTNGTLEGLKQSMLEVGVDCSVVLPIATTITQSNSINNFASTINGKDGIYSFGSVHPLQQDWEEELERIVDLGLLGIKLHPEYQASYIDSYDMIKILKKAEKLGLYTVLHTGADIGIAPPVHCMPDRLLKALSYVDGSFIIAAHMGGYRAWEDVLKYLAGSPIMLDTSYCLGEMNINTFEKIVQKHGTDKVLFGSDSPWENQAKTIELINKIGFSDDEYNQIMCKNAKKILKFK